MTAARHHGGKAAHRASEHHALNTEIEDARALRDDLAKRGETLVGRIRGQESTKATKSAAKRTTAAKATVAKSTAKTTTARKSAAKTSTAKTSTAKTSARARKAPAKSSAR